MRAFKNRDFSILFSGQLVSTIGNSLYNIALPWYVYTATGSKADLVYVGIAGSLPGVLGLFTGVFVDRGKKRPFLIAADLVRAALSALIALLALYHPAIWGLVIAVLLLQVAGTFFQPAENALLPMVVPAEDLPDAMGVNQSATGVAQLAGQFGGGALLSILGAPLLFFLNGASFLVSVFSIFLLKVKEPQSEKTDERLIEAWLDGLRTIRKSHYVVLVVIAAFVANGVLAPFDIAMTAWVKGPLHGSAFALGSVGAAFFLGMILGGTLLGRIAKLIPLKRVFSFGFVVFGALDACVGLRANLIYAIALLFVSGLVITLANGSMSTLLVQAVPGAMRGRFFGAFGALVTLAAPIGMAIGGYLMVHLALSIVFAIMGALCTLMGLLTLMPVRNDLAHLQAGGIAEMK